MTTARRKAWMAILIVGTLCATYTLIDMAAKAFERDIWRPLTSGVPKGCKP